MLVFTSHPGWRAYSCLDNCLQLLINSVQGITCWAPFNGTFPRPRSAFVSLSCFIPAILERDIYISQQLSVTAGSCERSPSGMVTVDTQPGNRADVASMHLHPPASKWQAIESSCLSVSLESLPTPPNSFNSQM